MQRLQTYQLHFYGQNVFLYDEERTLVLSANYFHDLGDGATLISGFRLENKASKDDRLAKLMVDKIRVFLAQGKIACKVIIWPGRFADEFTSAPDFDGQTYKSATDRLMLRDKKDDPQPVADNISLLNDDNIIDNDIEQLLTLLKEHTYWGKDCNTRYVIRALQNSYVFAMRENDQIVGFVRYATNGEAGYISDMVVHSDFRRQGRGKALLNACTQHIDHNCKFSALIHAGSGPGLEASDSLYAKNGGYALHDGKQIIFSYIKKPTPAPTYVETVGFYKRPNMRTIEPALLSQLKSYKISLERSIHKQEQRLSKLIVSDKDAIIASMKRRQAAVNLLAMLIDKEWGFQISPTDLENLKSRIKPEHREVLDYLESATTLGEDGFKKKL